MGEPSFKLKIPKGKIAVSYIVIIWFTDGRMEGKTH
jgi:hypothetical protein